MQIAYSYCPKQRKCIRLGGASRLPKDRPALAQPLPLFGRSAPMTVRAAHLTFRDLRRQRLERCSGIDQLADACPLDTANVVEFQDDHIGFAAIDARMRLQVLGNEDPIAVFVLELERLPWLRQNAGSIMISLLVVLVLAGLAIRTVPVALPVELFEWFSLFAFAATLHSQIVRDRCAKWVAYSRRWSR